MRGGADGESKGQVKVSRIDSNPWEQEGRPGSVCIREPRRSSWKGRRSLPKGQWKARDSQEQLWCP